MPSRIVLHAVLTRHLACSFSFSKGIEIAPSLIDRGVGQQSPRERFVFVIDRETGLNNPL